MDLSVQDLTKKLQSQGVKVPPETAAFQAVAKLELDPAEAAQKLYAHQIKMDRQQVMSYVKTFINPTYGEADWAGKVSFEKQLASLNPGSAGGQLLSADKIAQHLNVLNDAADGLQNGTFRSVNDIKNYLSKQLGGSAKDAFENTSRIVQTEIAKFVGGSAPTQGEIEAMEKNLDAASTPEQIRAVINGELGLVSGAYNALTQKVQDYFPYDQQNKKVTPTKEAAKLFGKRGQYVPGYGWPITNQQGAVVGLGFKNAKGQAVPTITW